MNRITNPSTKYPCRAGGGCGMEEYLYDHLEISDLEVNEDMCAHCPMKKYVNALAKYEDDIIDLLAAREELRALNFGGVDNWEWYGESIHNYLDGKKRQLNIKEEYPDFISVAEELVKEYE